MRARECLVHLFKRVKFCFDLSHSSLRPNPMDTKDQPANVYSLFTAIQQLKQTLQQRDALEFRLKNIAHLDSLTGVANRYALNEYIKLLENQPTQFSETCLMVIDIDHFKTGQRCVWTSDGGSGDSVCG